MKLDFRKTALTPQGPFTPARKGCVAGVGVATSPKPIKAPAQGGK